MKRFLLIFIVFNLINVSTHALSAENDDIGAIVYLSTVTGLLGDTVTYTIEIPLYDDERLLSDIAVPQSPGLTFTLKNSGIKHEPQGSKHIAVFLLQGFGIGQHTITMAPIEIYNFRLEKVRTVPVPYITYTIKSIIDDQEEVTLLENDALIEAPRNMPSILMVTLCLLSLLFVIWFIYYGINKAVPRNAPELMPTKTFTPRDYAFQELTKLQKTDLLREGKRKEFYTRLSDIVKHFLIMTFHVEIDDRTTSEIKTQMHEIIDSEDMNVLSSILEECDLVKFAKYQPDFEVIMHCMRKTKRFFESVDKT